MSSDQKFFPLMVGARNNNDLFESSMFAIELTSVIVDGKKVDPVSVLVPDISMKRGGWLMRFLAMP